MDTIHTLKLGMARAYLLKGRAGYVLIDAGVPGAGGRIVQKMNDLAIRPDMLKLGIVTHVHYDHVGGLAGVVKASGCPVMVHEAGADALAHGEMSIPGGQIFLTRQLVRLARRFPSVTAWVTRYEPVRADLYVNEETSLEPWGFSARAIPTPGHTKDSITVLTDDGRAFVGDLAYNELPFLAKTRKPPFAENIDILHNSWRLLLDRGARIIYPGHGEAFSADEL
ncbi:MAG: MBL fold metallo-hydrolase [Deltaproteobacteria bacterium]|nr:MBL fold metallo-hydrolase [Deltaproteobacteria bacterium]